MLERVLQVDVLPLGTPIYFGDISAQIHCFLERLNFILMTYDNYQKQLFDGHISVGIFLAMNMSADWYEDSLKKAMEHRMTFLSRAGGRVTIYPACDTLSFPSTGLSNGHV